MTESSAITITSEGPMLLAKVHCEHMGDDAAQALGAEVLAAAAQAAALPVVLDLSAVTMIPSLCIGSLVALWRNFSQGKRRFILVGLQPKVRETLTVCRLDKLFEICDSLDEAKTRLSRA